MNRKIVIDASYINGNLCYYGIVFNGFGIEKFLSIPSDYSCESFADIVKSEMNEVSQTKLIFDEYGYGAILKDAFPEARILKRQDMQNLSDCLGEAKTKLMFTALHSACKDKMDRMEFNKLSEEINNLTVENEHGKLKIVLKDKTLNKQRAMCYLIHIYSS